MNPLELLWRLVKQRAPEYRRDREGRISWFNPADELVKRMRAKLAALDLGREGKA